MASETPREGLLFVLVGPTAVGKNELMRIALEQVPHLVQMPTATTRTIRPSEREGREHFFVDEAGFQQLIDSKALLEYQFFHGNWYGTVRERLEEALARAQDQIADIEVLGASIVHRTYPDNSILIFVSPPDPATLETRIRKRGTDSPEEIEIRLRRIPFEMQFAAMCQYLIVNDDLEQAAAELVGIIQAERSRRNLRRFITARVMVRYQDRVVTDADTGELPSVQLQYGTMPQTAIQSLTVTLGLDNIIRSQSIEIAGEDMAPASYELSSMNSRPRMDLLYLCETDSELPLPGGWVWRRLDSGPSGKF